MKLKRIAIVLWIALVGSFCIYGVVGCGIFYAVHAVRAYFAEPINPDTYYPVVSVLDGDTFTMKVDEEVFTVRMLGIDTPETVDPRKDPQCYGREASNETKRLLKGNSVKVKLNPKREATDKYGRFLGYVFRGDGLFLNEHLLENGFAREYTYGKLYELQSEFKGIEKRAKKEKRGLWDECY